MNRVQTIESKIKELSPTEFAELRDWLLREDAQKWDDQIEGDAKSGKLDGLFQGAIEDHQAGKSREI